MKKALILFCLVYLLLPKQVKGCAPISPPVLLNQTISGNNLLLDWESESVWLCPGYTVQVELVCISSSFSGNGPFFLSPNLDKIMVPQAYAQQTINLSSLCPGQVYQFRAREGELSFAITSAWTSVFTFTVPGVLALPVLNLSVPTNTVCQGQATQLSSSLTACGPSPFSYSWFPSAGLSCTNCANPVASPSVSTTYTCFAEGNQLACWSAVSQTIAVTVASASDVATATCDFSLCSGESATVVLSGYAPYVLWQSSTNSGNSWSSVNTPSNSLSFTTGALSAGACYRASLGGCGLQYTTNVACVTVVPLPQLVVSSSASLVCEGQTANLSVTGASSYTWSNGMNSSSIAVTPTSITVYTVTGSNASGCVNEQSFTLQFSDCTGINSITAGPHDLSMYPNPNTGSFMIKSYQETNFLIVNELGRSFQTLKLDSTNNYTVSIINLAPGIYFIKQNPGGGVGKKICVTN